MSPSHLVTNALWVLPLIFQTAIALGMVRRKQETIFPFFFSYTVVVVFREILLLFLKLGKLYALIYWWGEALAVLLGVAVIFEILGHILPPYPSFRIVLKSMWTFAAVAGIAALLMLFLTNGRTEADRVFEFIILAERSARFLQACLLIAVIGLMSRLGLEWQNVSVGIVAGFGIYSALALVGWELRSHLHVISHATFVLLNSAAYNLAAIIWAWYMLRPPRGTPVEHLPKTNLAEWNSAVSEYVNQWYRRY